ncbi:hypothetical protein O181_061225 [Austropuccinia psidii MF-1]|uniref:Uncharacterized protein n=1 Tax=Austropuccinia psidii MF-1 TaxID=1389203 RepID=A0A9Q3ELY5_9BASI|nr:hypothetical protein [Austropuccinia psidii MF-1]
MVNSIREHSDYDQDPREEFLVEYKEETQLEIKDIQLEAAMPQDTENKNLCKNTQDAQTFLVTPTRGIAYIHGTTTKITIIIPHRKGNISLNPEFLFLEEAYIQGFLLGNNYQRMYGIEIYNSKNRHNAIGTNKERKFLLYIYQTSTQDPLEEFLNEFKEGQFSANLTSKQKIRLMKILGKNRPEFAIGKEPLNKIRGNDIEIFLDMERIYPPMLKTPPYPESLETRKEIEKHIDELLDMDFIRKIGHNEIVEITTPVLITWHDGKSRLCGDSRALNEYTKAHRYLIPWTRWQKPNAQPRWLV